MVEIQKYEVMLSITVAVPGVTCLNLVGYTQWLCNHR